MTVRDYAAKLGIGEQTMKHRVYAAQVVSHVGNSWSAAFDGPPEKELPRPIIDDCDGVRY
jgi:hypothetical protein